MWHRSAHQATSGYDEFYSFQQPPFSLTPDPQFVYPSASHERALQTILHALTRREGLIVVTGEIGCGKTTLCRRLLELLPPRTFLSLVLNPFLAADNLLKQVLEDFGLVPSAEVRGGALAHASCHDLARTLEGFLGSLAQLNASAVVIVDEAQNLPLRTIEQIRLLSNFETNSAKLLQIILVGQLNFEPILALEEMRQLNQRISRRCRLESLSAREVSAYVEYRLSVARGREMPGTDASRVQFVPGALRAVAQLSDGVPRIINLLCDRALEIGCSRGETSITRGTVIAAAQDLEIPVPVIVRFAGLRPITTGAVCAALVAGVSVASWKMSSPALPSQSPGATVAAPAAAAPRATPPAQTVASRSTPDPPSAPPTTGVRAQASVASGSRPVPPAPAPISTVVASAASFELTVASFETAGRASAVANNLVGRGYPARVVESGRWYVLIVGPYTSMNEADLTRQALTRLSFTDIKVLASN